VEAGQAAVFGNLKPLVGLVLAALVLAEPLTAVQLGSGAVVLAGVWLATYTGKASLPRRVTCHRHRMLGAAARLRRLPAVRLEATGEAGSRVDTQLRGTPHPAPAVGASPPHAS
jgi:hypothetical protein